MRCERRQAEQRLLVDTTDATRVLVVVSGAVAKGRRFTEEEILAAVRAAAPPPAPPLTTVAYTAARRHHGEWPAVATVADRFGGWDAACRAAGVVPAPVPRWTAEVVLDAFARWVANNPGHRMVDYRAATTADRALPGEVTVLAYLGGRWRVAVAAAQAHAEVAGMATTTDRGASGSGDGKGSTVR